MINNLSGTTLADHVEEEIIQYIKSHDLHPGDALPNEMEFSRMLGVSRNVIREAMSRLRMLGLIQTRTKRGLYKRYLVLRLSYQCASYLEEKDDDTCSFTRIYCLL